MSIRPAVVARTFPACSSCVAEARDWVYASCAERGVDLDTCESARLLTSEVVTNAIIHTTTQRVVIRLLVGPTLLEVAVDDADPRPPRPRRAGLVDTGGRGLTLVGVLADEWGTRTSPDGKTIWFRVLRS